MLAIILYGIINGLQIGLIALAFQLHIRALKMFDVSQAGVFIIASYCLIAFNNLFEIGTVPVLLLAWFASWLVCYLVTLIIYRYIYLPFFSKGTGSTSFMIISLILYVIIINGISLMFSPEVQIISLPFLSFDSFEVQNLIISKIQIMQLFIAIVLFGFSYFVLTRTKLGIEITAVSENEELYSIMGYNINTLRVRVFIISSILLSVGAILRTLEIGVDPYNSGFSVFLLGAIAVIVGGVHSFKGALIGSLFLGVIMNLSAWFISGQWQEAISLVVLIVALLVRKEGFFSIKMRVEG